MEKLGERLREYAQSKRMKASPLELWSKPALCLTMKPHPISAPHIGSHVAKINVCLRIQAAHAPLMRGLSACVYLVNKERIEVHVG